jgi:hypothetical protein
VGSWGLLVISSVDVRRRSGAKEARRQPFLVVVSVCRGGGSVGCERKGIQAARGDARLLVDQPSVRR